MLEEGFGIDDGGEPSSLFRSSRVFCPANIIIWGGRGLGFKVSDPTVQC